MMIQPEFKEITDWKPKDLHKQIGQLIFKNPGDSDINEGDFMAKIWFVTTDFKMYVMKEWDIRNGEK